MEFNPHSNEALRRAMPNALDALKQGKITIIGTPPAISRHEVSSAPWSLKLMIATYLEKSVIFHMSFPGLRIDEVPDEDDQEEP